jgi:hypothetical protein
MNWRSADCQERRVPVVPRVTRGKISAGYWFFMGSAGGTSCAGHGARLVAFCDEVSALPVCRAEQPVLPQLRNFRSDFNGATEQIDVVHFWIFQDVRSPSYPHCRRANL